jgi:hypothetical protein
MPPNQALQLNGKAFDRLVLGDWVRNSSMGIHFGGEIGCGRIFDRRS